MSKAEGTALLKSRPILTDSRVCVCGQYTTKGRYTLPNYFTIECVKKVNSQRANFSPEYMDNLFAIVGLKCIKGSDTLAE